MGGLQRFGAALDRFALALNWVGMWIFVPVLGLVVTFNVIMRYVFDNSLMSGMEMEQLLLLLAFVSGLPYCTAKRGHVVLHLLYDHVGPSVKTVFDLLTGLLGGLFFGALAWRSVFMAIDMHRFGESGQFLDVPFWPVAVVMALCAISVTLQFPLMALRDIGARYLKPAAAP